MARKHGFFELKIDGLLFVDHLISYLKIKEKEALNILKGVNKTNLNRKITSAVIGASLSQKLDMNTFMKEKVLGGFKLRTISKTREEQVYNLGHAYITGRGATELITKSSQRRANSISYKGMMSVLMYGRKGYYIPKQLKDLRKPMMWVNKPHYAQKSGFTGGFIRGKRVYVPAYKGVDYMKYAAQEVEAWMDKIQDKFLSKGFNTINL